MSAVRRTRERLLNARARLAGRPTRKAVAEAAGPIAAALAAVAKTSPAGSPGLDRPAGPNGPVWGRRPQVAGGRPQQRRGVAAAVRELRQCLADAIESIDDDGAPDCRAFDLALALAVTAEFAPPRTPGLDVPFEGVCWGRDPFAGGIAPAGARIVYRLTAVHPDGTRERTWETASRAVIRAEQSLRRETFDELIVERRVG